MCNVLGTRMHRVTNFDRRMLVWVKRYPSLAEVPDEVTYVTFIFLQYLELHTKVEIESKNIRF